MVSSTYTWNDPQKRVLKLECFNGASTTTSYIPAVKGLPEYNYFRAWDAQSGQDAIPFRPPVTTLWQMPKLLASGFYAKKRWTFVV